MHVYTQVQLFLTLASLYRDMHMFRKAAFYSRIAAMQFVAPANCQPSWLQCYNLLIHALPGYQLSLDPKEMLSGWLFDIYSLSFDSYSRCYVLKGSFLLWQRPFAGSGCCRICPVHFLAGWYRRRPVPGFSFVRFGFVYVYSFYRMTCMHSMDYAVARCISVCLTLSVHSSVTCRYCVETAKHIINVFSPSGSRLVFLYQTGWQYSDRYPPNGSVEFIGLWKKSRFSTNISFYLGNDAR